MRRRSSDRPGRPGIRLCVLLAAGVLGFVPVTRAQQSASYHLSEHVFNEGGHPLNGAAAISPSYRVRPAAIGDLASARVLTSASYRMNAGFISAYLAPGETLGLRLLADRTTLEWRPNPSVGTYNLYRDLLANLRGGEYGSCDQHGIIGETATDPDRPSSGRGFFYLVTAENRLGEEGTKGWDSAGNERLNPHPCP